MIEIAVAEFPAVRVAFVRATTPVSELGATISRLYSQLAQAGLEMADAPLLYYTRWSETDCEIEAAIPIAEDAEPEGVEVKTLPSIQCVTAEHRGPYDGLSRSWAEFWVQVEQEGFEGVMPCWDRYVSDPEVETDPSRLITELYIPVVLAKFV